MSECVSISPSSAPIRSISLAMRSEPKRRMRSSSSDRKNCEAPGSPCRPARQSLRDIDAHGSHQHRELQLVQSLSLLENRVVLLATRLVDEVLPIVANNRAVRGNHRYTELVDLVEFRFLSLGSTSHPGKL